MKARGLLLLWDFSMQMLHLFGIRFDSMFVRDDSGGRYRRPAVPEKWEARHVLLCVIEVFQSI